MLERQAHGAHAAEHQGPVVIALVDYGAGNLTSVRKALAALGASVWTPTVPGELARAHGIIVPGVGHFDSTRGLTGDWRAAISATVADGTPLLGICVGLQWRALAAGIDVTDDLRKAGVPLLPLSDDTVAALEKMPKQTIDEFVARGIVIYHSYDQGEGMKDYITPMWTLRSAYWWRTTFSAGKLTEVEHAYKPSVGGTVGVSFLDENDQPAGERFEEYRTRYCLDDNFIRIAQKSVKDMRENRPYLFENWISYILKTGGNWDGTIKKFTLTIDKGEKTNFVSFCGENVKKTGPTTFEMSAQDFYPARDLDILILKPSGQ